MKGEIFYNRKVLNSIFRIISHNIYIFSISISNLMGKKYKILQFKKHKMITCTKIRDLLVMCLYSIIKKMNYNNISNIVTKLYSGKIIIFN